MTPGVPTPGAAHTAVTVAATNAVEGGTGTFTFTRTGDTTAALTVNYTVGGTATSGTDYTALTGTVTFAAGAATATVTVAALGDNVVEGNETVTVTLASGTGYAYSASPVTLTIADDPPVIAVTASDTTEGSATGGFTFTRTGGKLSAALTATYTVTGTATSGTDYTALSGTVTFDAGEDQVEVFVKVLSDTTPDDAEAVIATINSGGSNYTIDDEADEATVSITDVPPGGASGTAWIDANDDGIQNGGESVLAGVTVNLLDENGDPAKDADGVAVAGVITDSSGHYSFTGLFPKGDTLEFTAPSGFVLDGLGNGRQETILVESSQTAVFNLPAYSDTQASTISGTVHVYLDSGDSDAPGLSGVTVELFDENAVLVDSTTTDGAGEYSFTNSTARVFRFSVSCSSGRVTDDRAGHHGSRAGVRVVPWAVPWSLRSSPDGQAL